MRTASISARQLVIIAATVLLILVVIMLFKNLIIDNPMLLSP